MDVHNSIRDNHLLILPFGNYLESVLFIYEDYMSEACYNSVSDLTNLHSYVEYTQLQANFIYIKKNSIKKNFDLVKCVSRNEIHPETLQINILNLFGTDS